MEKKVELSYVKINGEGYFKMSNHDLMDPFFMSIVSDGNHWMFISSNGGLTAGRKDAHYALFPYYTDDKLTEMSETAGAKTIIRISAGDHSKVWEPFSIRYQGLYACDRNLYKSEFGNKIIFEEINQDLGLTFKYEWSSSNQFGFVRESTLINHSSEEITVELVDGLQNIMPYGIPQELQSAYSNLVDAYKRSELVADAGLGIYALSAIIVDRAEPSEALKANTIWSKGLEDPTYLLSSKQLDRFRNGDELEQEVDMKARKGAYFLNKKLQLTPNTEKQWTIVANVNQGPSDVAGMIHELRTKTDLEATLRKDIANGTAQLRQLVSSADGFQATADDRRNARHYSNTLFNIMRGGIIDRDYIIEKDDFEQYLKKANKEAYTRATVVLKQLAQEFSFHDLKKLAIESEDSDFTRLAIEYLPLKFSRRHGDPSRPWNRFSINTRNEEDGSKILDYQGNWRDIFQNWEALAHSYPEYIDSMIFKFLNVSTFEGYNPYRVTKDGFDWEVIEEHDPWSYIGYWGDHQIIYLLKFLEFAREYFPGRLSTYFDSSVFAYANVPYKIKSYEEILQHPKDTISFDFQLDGTIRKRREALGSDGALLLNQKGGIHKVNFIEKILATALAKVSNFIPEGGIWLNTQRPEWNDANNALVGNGVSMVTLYYLRRFLQFFKENLAANSSDSFSISAELHTFLSAVMVTLESHKALLSASVSNKDRKAIMDGLGTAGSVFRSTIYQKDFNGQKEPVSRGDVLKFINLTLEYLDHSIEANKRSDNMYHAYNLMTLENDAEVSISYLSEMLEGQVAVLSSGYLTSKQSIELLDALKASSLFREDQYSYILYPNKELPGFTQKNCIPSSSVESSELMKALIADGNTKVLERDTMGDYHFNGNFNNAGSLKSALESLPDKYQPQVTKESPQVLRIFEEVFNHKAFTGRSGTFFGYEGLGSIYWHMVSKLLLAVQETCQRAIEEGQSAEVVGHLLEHYYEINAGIGVHKSPELYGAFPIDPYSHTPAGKGAQQPGMTGQVKEDILSRQGELGVSVKEGQVHFQPTLLRKEEFLASPSNFTFVNLSQKEVTLTVEPSTLVFTYCQVPVIYRIADKDEIKTFLQDGSQLRIDGFQLDAPISQELFQRTGKVVKIEVGITEDHLR